MEKMRIGDACNILNGFAFKSENYMDSGIRIIRIANVQKGFVEDTMPVFYPINSEGLDKYMLEEGDLLISLTGNVGRVALLEKEMLPAALNQRVACLRLKTDKISKRYLFHILNSNYFEQQCIQSSKGVAQKNMSTEWLKDYEIPLHSAERQAEIISVLDRIELIMADRKKELKKLNDLIKARFVEMFGDPEFNNMGWNKEYLGSLCNVGSSKRIYQNEQSTEGIPFLRISDVVNLIDTGALTCDLYIPESRFDELFDQGLVPQEGDILLTARGTLGKCYIVQAEDRFYFQDGMISWLSKFSDSVTPLYISNLFKMPGFRKQIDELQAGSTVAYLSIAMTKKLSVMLPPIDLQKQFEFFVKQVEKSRAIVKKGLDEITLLYECLLQRFFRI